MTDCIDDSRMEALKGKDILSNSYIIRVLQVALLFCFLASTMDSLAQKKGFYRKKSTPKLAQSGDTFFIQFSMFHEKNQHITTNYRRGSLIPINTKVHYVSEKKNTIYFKVHGDDRKIKVVNAKDYSGEDLSGVFNRTFSSKPVDLSGYTNSEQKNIKSGTVTLGMSKAAVICAIGYPPKHRTSSLKLKQWRYWKHRFGTFLVMFEADKVTKVVGLDE